MKPIRVSNSDYKSDLGKSLEVLTGCVYLLGFPGTRCIYIGSTKRSAVRMREHKMWLRGKRHPNHPLQEAYDAHPDNLLQHVLLNVYGHSNAELRSFEWELSICLHSSYTVLNSDTTVNVKYHLEWEDMRDTIDLVNQLMNFDGEKL